MTEQDPLTLLTKDHIHSIKSSEMLLEWLIQMIDILGTQPQIFKSIPKSEVDTMVADFNKIEGEEIDQQTKSFISLTIAKSILFILNTINSEAVEEIHNNSVFRHYFSVLQSVKIMLEGK